MSRTGPLIALTVLGLAGLFRSASAADEPAVRAEVIRVADADIQKTLDAAPPNSVVLCDSNRQLTLSAPLTIRKPLTLRGLNARLPDGLGKTPLVVVEAQGVTVADFTLTGNGDSVSQNQRAPLLVIGAGDFRVENGRLNNSAKDGIMIDGDVLQNDIVGGVVRDIVGRKVIRDVVSISGSGQGAYKIRNVLVDNVRCYDSELRGAVEVSDGAENITVRKVYAEGSVYAVDVQDHNKSGQINRNVVVEDIYAVRCKHAIRTSNHDFGHANLTVRDITAERCTLPIQISHTKNLTLTNARVVDHEAKGLPICIRNCQGVLARDIVVENTTAEGPAMLVEDCGAATLDAFTLRGTTDTLACGICFRITADKSLYGLCISNALARNVQEAGIVLERKGKKGALADYVISGNLARVADKIQGPGAIVVNNAP